MQCRLLLGRGRVRTRVRTRGRWEGAVACQGACGAAACGAAACGAAACGGRPPRPGPGAPSPAAGGGVRGRRRTSVSAGVGDEFAGRVEGNDCGVVRNNSKSGAGAERQPGGEHSCTAPTAEQGGSAVLRTALASAAVGHRIWIPSEMRRDSIRASSPAVRSRSASVRAKTGYRSGVQGRGRAGAAVGRGRGCGHVLGCVGHSPQGMQADRHAGCSGLTRPQHLRALQEQRWRPSQQVADLGGAAQGMGEGWW